MKKSKRTLRLVSTFVVASLFVVASMGSVLAKKTTLTVWFSEYQKNCIDAAIEGFYELYPDIKIEYGPLMGGADAFQNMVLALSAGEGIPDVAGPESSRLAQYVTLGGLAEITEKVLPYYEKFDTAKWIEATHEEGRIYAIPLDSGPVALYYRRDVFEQAGLASDPDSVHTLLDTWNDVYEVGKLIKERTNKYIFPQAKANNDFRIFDTLMWQQEAGYTDREGKIAIDSPKAVRTLEYLGKLWKEDLLLDAVSWTAGWYAALDEGEVATIPNAVWLGGFLWSWIAAESVGKWGVVPLPVWEEDGVRSSNDGGSVMLITEACKDKEAAWKLIEYLCATKEAQMAAWKAMDSFPSLKACWEDPFAEEPVPFFGGQAYRKVFVEAAKQIPWWSYTKDYSEMNSIMQVYVTAYALGEIESAQEALTQTAAEIRARTGRE